MNRGCRNSIVSAFIHAFGAMLANGEFAMTTSLGVSKPYTGFTSCFATSSVIRLLKGRHTWHS
ncbi:hypothetical protein HDV63DRAFT_399197 [Trichoderma sp. SZMC 28014]